MVKTTMKKLYLALWSYVKDWKNLLAHAIVGIVLLLVALFLPVRPIFRVFVLIAVVAANLIRTKAEKKKRQAESEHISKEV